MVYFYLFQGSYITVQTVIMYTYVLVTTSKYIINIFAHNMSDTKHAPFETMYSQGVNIPTLCNIYLILFSI